MTRFFSYNVSRSFFGGRKIMRENICGKFIALEGIDGSGKSTQLAMLAERFRAEGADVCETREPTDRTVGRLIRRILTGEESADGRAIAAFFAADRVDHLLHEGGICDMLRRGSVVLCDRYYFSSYAYHGVDMPIERVVELNSVSADILRPDLTVFIDVSPETALERIVSGRDHVELFETMDRLTRVRDKYFEAFELLGASENVAIVDGNADPNTVCDRAWDAITREMSIGK